MIFSNVQISGQFHLSNDSIDFAIEHLFGSIQDFSGLLQRFDLF